MVVSIQSSQKSPKLGTKNTLEKLSNPKLSLSAANQLQLLTELQSTLNMESLLNIFLRHLNNFVSVSGLHFREEKRQLSIKIGKQSIHSCGYRLLEESTDYGEIVLKRSNRFSSSELELIESLVICLLTPITNALQYADAVKAAINEPILSSDGQLILADSLDREIELAKRHNHSLSIILLKISAESSSNIETLATETTAIMQQASRRTDMLFRTGNNGFVLMLHKADSANTCVVIKRLKARLFSTTANNEKARLDLGTATLTGTDSMSSLLERAEKTIIGVG